MNIKKIAALTLAMLIIASLVSALSLNASASEELPTAFPSEGVDELPYSTVAKNQNPYGTCWAFAAVACAEADAIKNHGADKNTIDLSEWHLIHFSYTGERDGGDKVSLLGGAHYTEIGGHDIMAYQTLSSGIGFADESVAPYDVLVRDKYATIDSSLMYESIYRIGNVIILDIANDPDGVKSAVLEYGAAAVSYHNDNSFLNTESGIFAQYCPDATRLANHAVTIVGWDDSYPADNFKPVNGQRPQNDGAWLVKNSWGESFGINGYFWISYEDATLMGGAAYDVIPADSFDTIYQHDGGISSNYVTSEEDIEYANIFTCSPMEILNAISVAAVDIGKDNGYELKIYGDASYDTENGFTYKRVLYSRSGYLHNGYNTLFLDTPVDITGYESFAVSFKLNAGLLVDMDSTVKLNGRGATYVSDVVVDGNQTVYKEGDLDWCDAVNDSTPWNARIKAFSVKADNRLIPYVYEYPTPSSIAESSPLSSATFTGGIVCDPLTGQEISGSWSFYNESLIPSDGNLLEAVFTPNEIENYCPVSVFVQVTVVSPDTPDEVYPPVDTPEEEPPEDEFPEWELPEDEFPEWELPDDTDNSIPFDPDVEILPDLNPDIDKAERPEDAYAEAEPVAYYAILGIILVIAAAAIIIGIAVTVLIVVTAAVLAVILIAALLLTATAIIIIIIAVKKKKRKVAKK